MTPLVQDVFRQLMLFEDSLNLNKSFRVSILWFDHFAQSGHIGFSWVHTVEFYVVTNIVEEILILNSTVKSKYSKFFYTGLSGSS